MKELDFLKVIKKELSDNSYIGDDCAYLEDLGIFVTQDSLVEDVHFSLKTTSPYLLGRKSVAVNLSDIAASLSEPKYIFISLSLPAYIDELFVKEFYKGANEICNEYGVIIAGGDITGSNKVFISVVAIGKKSSKYISSRAYAKTGDKIIITGNSGSSSCGLFCLQNNICENRKMINAHLNPKPRIDFSKNLSKNIHNNIAAMDTSDGLIDALFKISESSKCKIEIDAEKIPVDKELIEIASDNNKNYLDWVFWGGEDYELIACIPEESLDKLDKNSYSIIGTVKEISETGELIINKDLKKIAITKEIFENKSFDHFKGTK